MDTHAHPARPAAIHAGPALPAARPRRPGEFHIPSLDGIRAVSFLIVFVAHAGLERIVPGGFGVTVFFFLSGFLITTLLRLEHENTGHVSLRHFYLRRVLRIFPPFYLILSLAILAHLAVETTPLWPQAILAQCLHVTNYWSLYQPAYPPPSGTGVYWSLAVEEHFYLVFPCVFILLQRRLAGRYTAQAGLLLGTCAAVLAWRMVLILGLDADWTRTYYASDTRIDSILFGCALALGANPAVSQRLPGSLHAWRRLALPAGVLALLFSFVYRADWFRETARYTLQGLALIPVFVVAIRQPGWGPFRLLNHPWVRHVGLLSYSLYLLHTVILNALRAATPLTALPRALLGLTLALLIAEGIHRWIERPCARLRRRLAVVKTAGVTENSAAPGVPARSVATPPASAAVPVAQA